MQDNIIIEDIYVQRKAGLLFMKQRKNIALFMGMLETEFSRNICEGAVLGAEEIDANLFIFPGGIINAAFADKDFTMYRRQYNVLYSYASAYKFDAIIFEYGTIVSLLNEQQKKEFLKHFGDVPLVLLVGEQEGYSSIGIDNKSGIHEAVAHLIEEHNCKKIGFVSGPKTNFDANQRLEAYYETMEKYGLEINEKWITYGDFSEYCDAVIDEYIKNNKDIDAIVFANDQMALCGYKAMKKLGLKPGNDIQITSYDDSPLAVLLEPHLSSVKVDARELAYRAMLEIPKVIAGREMHVDVGSKFVVRESCGCDEASVIDKTINVMMESFNDKMILQLADNIFDKYYNTIFDTEEKTRLRKVVENYFYYYFHLVQDDGLLNMDDEQFRLQYRKFMQTCQNGHIELKKFLLIDQILYGYVNQMLRNDEDRLHLLEQVTFGRNEIIGSIGTKEIISVEKQKTYETLLASVASDMLVCTANEKEGYRTVISKLQKLDFDSSCILTYENAVNVQPGEIPEIPKKFCVKAYYNKDEVHLYKGDERTINMAAVFENRYIPLERRIDMLVLPLFVNTTQYGIMLVETPVSAFNYAMQIASQLSVAIDVYAIMKKQNEIKSELEHNLKKTVENNRILDEMSRMDPLTGILNRRGFLDDVKRILTNPENFGKRAVAIYADMDNLKIINDEFGHDDGDYALKIIARALSNSFSKSDVVARMGGDEFAAFAILDEEDLPAIIKTRIQAMLAAISENDDKPYYVGMSVGIEEFIIDSSSVLEHILTKADHNLYQEKKNKVKRVYKNNTNNV